MIDVGVCISGCVCHAWHSMLMTLDPWNFWESLALYSCNITRAEPRRTIQCAERHPGTFPETNLSSTPLQNWTGWPEWDTTPHSLLRGFLHVGQFATIAPHFALYGVQILRTGVSWLPHLSSQDFCSGLLAIVELFLQVKLHSSTSTREMDNSPGGGK